jgi:hypothetical protein
MDLSPESCALVKAAITDELGRHLPLIGVSCIAVGADTIFARAVLDFGGQLEVVIPSRDYRQTKVPAEHAHIFDDLVTQAAVVHVMDFDTAGRDAYQAANEFMLSSCEFLCAVWDGRPSPDQGGTAAVVASAKARRIPVTIVWPLGATRV